MSDFKNTELDANSASLFVQAAKNCLLSKRRELTPEIFRDIVTKLGVLQTLTKASSIVIKPNFAGGSVLPQDSHALTDTKLLREVVEGIRSINDDVIIYIAESDSAGMGFAFLKFSNLGLDNWELNNVKLLDLSRDRLRKVELAEAKFFKENAEPLWLSETLLDADILISLANLKTHAVTKYTGACKNLFGLLPREDKFIYHPFVNEVIYDLVRTVKPSLSIVDGFRAMEQNGPIIGRPISIDLRVYASDAVMADIVSCHLIRINYHRVNHLNLLVKDMAVPEIVGVPVFNVRYRTPLLAFFNYLGLKIQRFGHGIYMYGHRIHSVYSFLLFFMMSVRPLLLLFFDLETLKRWKRKIVK
jgi:uncharacterized protein (DUF362 family)